MIYGTQLIQNTFLNKFCHTASSTVIFIGTAPDISNLQLSINVEVKRPIDDNELQVYCDFNPSANTDYYYKVAWAMSQNSISTHELHLSERVQYLSKNDFRLKTMMTEKHLKRFGLGLTVSISIFVD
ncbi:hypothetical protein DPMN_025928 [Dreissena polymorpha]|uniref:Uncharacterized protein n=1 Tax=Dreissena polymorpha TaxID=45954 RepID=A0A9D4LSE7_DREPO|nr:hypothetical protein DPMN_025928 [Dreissena polymorpha]